VWNRAEARGFRRRRQFLPDCRQEQATVRVNCGYE
jgi:hypothetical protein